MCKLGIVTYNIARDWDLETILDCCRSLGLGGVELRTTHAHKVEVDLPKAGRADVRRRFADSPVVLSGLGSVCEYHSPEPAELRRNIELSRAFIELASDVGAQGIKVRPNALPEGVPAEKTIEQIGRALGKVAAFGADHGVAVRLEMHGPGTSRPEVVKRIMDQADHLNARICWNCNPDDLDAGGSIDTAFELLKDRIDLVHIHALYDDYPYKRLFALLKSIGYTGFCLAEIPASPEPETVLRYYRKCFEALQPFA